MSDYSQIVKKVNQELISFVNRYEVIDDKDPITSALIKKFRKLNDSFNTSCNQYIQLLYVHQKNFDESFYNISTDNTTQRMIITDKMNESLEIITEKYVKKINAVNDEIEMLKKKASNKIEGYKQEIEVNAFTSEQKEDIFNNECDENIKKYEYQRSAAKDSYNQNIKIFNDSFLVDSSLLKSEHYDQLVDFDNNTKEIIESLNSKIEECNKELEEVNEKLTQVRNQMKEKFRQEAVSLNDEIKVLLDEKNKIIVTAREKYSKSLELSSIEKDSLKNKYQQESQRILKDFVYNMTELDEYINRFKDNHNKSVERENRQFYYQFLKVSKNQDSDIKKIMDDGFNINGEYDKYTRRLIRHKKQSYYKQNQALKQQQNDSIRSLELIYQREVENTRSNKTLLDLDKSYSLQLINERESRDNKYYQELNSIYENEMNLLIKVSNMKYNKKANLVKCQSRIRSKQLEKDLDISEANFQKKIEMIKSEINQYKLEIDGAQRLQRLVHEYEDTSFNNTLNHKSVSNLLEIEKCKILDDFNRRQYEHNVMSSKNNQKYSQNKLNLSNDRFTDLKNISIKITEEQLEKDLVDASFKIKEYQISEITDKQIQERNDQYELDFIDHNLLYQRFKEEIKLIHQTIGTAILMVRETESFTNKFLSTFFSNIAIRPEYFNVINIFIKDYIKIISGFYTDIIQTMTDLESDVIYKRLDFEEKFKFKTYYNDLLEVYEADRKKLISKKKSITDTIVNYTNTTEIFRSRIFSYENQNIMLKQKIEEKGKEPHDFLVKDYNNNVLTIRDLNRKIEDITHLKDNLNKDNETIDLDLKKLDKEYNTRVNEIEKMQYNSAVSFYDLRRSLTKYSQQAIEKIQDKLNVDYENMNAFFKNEKLVFELSTGIKIMNNNIFEQFYKIISIFSNQTNAAIKNDKALLLTQYNNDIERLNNKYVDNIEANAWAHDKKTATHTENLQALNKEIIDTEKKYDDLGRSIDNEHNQNVKHILDLKKESISLFYKEFYAMCENISGIKENYKLDTDHAVTKFSNDKATLSRRIQSQKNTIKINLDDFLRAKQDLINHLPSATKFQSQQMNKETREINYEIDTQIKNETTTATTTKKTIQKTIASIDVALDQTLQEQELLHQKSILKEKKNHVFQIKHLEKTLG